MEVQTKLNWDEDEGDWDYTVKPQHIPPPTDETMPDG